MTRMRNKDCNTTMDVASKRLGGGLQGGRGVIESGCVFYIVGFSNNSASRAYMTVYVFLEEFEPVNSRPP